MVVADFDLRDPQGRTGLDVLARVTGLRILFSGLQVAVPEGVLAVAKADLAGLVATIAAVDRPSGGD